MSGHPLNTRHTHTTRRRRSTMTSYGWYLLGLLVVPGCRMSNASTSTTATTAATTAQVVYGDNCDNPTQCLTTNAICNGFNICACDDTHYYDAVSDTCTQKQAFGGACTDTSQCDTTSDTNIECIQTVTDKKCLCKNGLYRPNTSCVQTGPLKPTIAGTPAIGTGNIDITWTNTDATGEYTSNYTVTWSQGTPGSPASVPASQKSYNIQSLSPGTRYTVTVTHTITRGGRSQTIDSDSREFTTSRQIFGGVCTGIDQCDTSVTNIECVQTTVTEKKCLCKNGTYESSASSCTETSPLKPTITGTPTTGTFNIYISWTNTDANGGYTSSYAVTWSPGTPGSPPASVPANQKNFNIQSLSPGTTYTVIVMHTITQYGRSQTITSDQRTFSTKQVFGGDCSNQLLCDSTTDPSIECTPTTGPNTKCLCKDTMYNPSSSVPCTNIGPLKPVITDPPSTGTTNTYISWTNTDATGGYTSTYTVTWSPGTPASPASVPANQKNFNIQSLSPGTTYTVTVRHTITQYGRSQTITSDPKTFTTNPVFGSVCSNQPECNTADDNIQCIQTTESNKKCLCKDGMYKSADMCTDIRPLKPVITDPPSTGTTNTYISWTNIDATGGYTSTYTVTWSPGTPASPPSVPANQKNYDIRSLSPGTTYNVTVMHTITQYGRSQTITSDPKTFTTRIGYNEACTQKGLCYDASANCYSGRCRCDPRFYRSTACVSINQLKPTTVTADVQNTTTMTVTWTAPSNNVVMGYLVSFTPKDINPISVGRDIMTTPITGLTPGRLYNVTVKTRVTYLQGRDEMTDTLSAAPNRTTPASVLDLDMQTYRAAPNITIVFPKAAGDADRYLVTLSGQDRDNYTQQHRPVNTGQGLISVVFTGVVSAVSYDLNIVTQSGNIQSSPYTTVIHVLAPRAEKVNNLKLFDNTSRSVAVEWSRPLKPNGYIYEYIVDVRTHPVCVKRIIINCTECNRDMVNITETAIECQTNMTVAITEADIENTAHVIQYNITGLNPDTAYSIDVVAVNEKGRGRPGQVNINTSMEGAGDPTNFTAESKSSSEITLTWDPPQPRPGVTQYNITVYEKQENESYNTFNIIPVAGWETNTYTITNLSSYWFYKFDIVAQTSEGASAIVRSGPERTMESEPTRVVGLKIVKVLGVFNEVQVSWKCPNQKDGRNGEIVNANLNYFTNQQSTYVEPVRMNKNFTNKGDCMWNVKVNVTTEFKYVFHVRLYNKGFAGSVVSVSKDIAGGAPSQTAVMDSVREGTGESETPPLLICPRCLYDRTNGQVYKTGLIVCRKENCGQVGHPDQTTTAVDYDNMANWNAANAQDFGISYRATKDDWLDGVVGRSSLPFTLGNEDCSGNTNNVFWNGKLPTGQTFIVYAFSCTNHGCTTSSRIEITTGKQQVPVAAVVGGVVAAVVVILVVTGIFLILRRRKAHNERSKRSRDEVHARAEVRPEQDDIYDKIPDCQMVTVDNGHSNEGYINYASGHSTRKTDNTYDALATYQNADAHDYGRINIETRFK
ncbi:fibronectin-like [Haliotis asinina]|uniref:fibronectin-like n=1 Tax=Haliotis asinina TaxID=109174 RepID=UPI003531C61A